MTTETDFQLTTIRRYSFLHEALIAREVLDAEHVEAFVPDENTLGVNPGYVNAMGGIRLQVRTHDVARALEILGPEPPA